MNVRKLLALATTLLLLAALFTGCGAASKEMATEDAFFADNGSTAGGSTAPDAGSDYSESGTLTDSAQSGESITSENQKLIRKIWLEAETETMDPLLDAVEKRIGQLGGYVENREVRNGSQYSGYTHRYASLTIRIPADKLEEFVSDVSEQANIVSKRETADDVTLSYVATESRMKMLQTEQERLLELLSKAKDMTEILQIEERLMDVRSELEQVTSQLRVMENQVSYSTVYLDLDEVREYTPVEEEPDGFFQRIGKGFVKSMKDMGNICTEIVISLIVAIPYLIPLAVIAVVIVILVKVHKKKSRKNPPTSTQKDEK